MEKPSLHGACLEDTVVERVSQAIGLDRTAKRLADDGRTYDAALVTEDAEDAWERATEVARLLHELRPEEAS